MKKPTKQEQDAKHHALVLLYNEVRQFHATAYPKCDGGCPAHEAMEAAEPFLTEDEKHYPC